MKTRVVEIARALTRCLFAACAAIVPARAQDVADFYRNRTVTLIVGAGEGGFYDQNARLLAPILRKYIPGSPAVIAQNMPGASQLRATEHAYNLAARDGTALLVAQPYVILNKLLNKDLKFEIQRMNWIGRVGQIDMGGFVSEKSRAKSFEDARRMEIILGGNAANGPASMIPWALNRLAGAKFRVILGYQSQSAEALALERGEIQGIGNGSLGDLAAHHLKVRVLYSSGIARIKAWPDIPTILELVSEADRPVMDIMASMSTLGLTVMATPDIPADRLAALRGAFDRAMKDPAYLAGLARLNFAPEPMKGADLADYVREHFSPSEAMIERLRRATAQM